jgi:hypothetical protein
VRPQLTLSSSVDDDIVYDEMFDQGDAILSGESEQRPVQPHTSGLVIIEEILGLHL